VRSGQENDIVHLGDVLAFTIIYRNASEIIIKDAVVQAKIVSDLVDPKSIKPEQGGYLDGARSAVIWTPANVKELKFLDPGESHALTFRGRLRDNFPISSRDDRNFIVRVTASIESIDVPPYLALTKITVEDNLELKVGTAPKLLVEGFFTDTSSGIQNAGPIPPRVDQQTTYSIHWQITVPANDLENVEIRTSLPTGVRPTGIVTANIDGPPPRFNEASGEVSWMVDRVPANTGFLLPTYEAVFQIAFIPSITQARSTVELVRPSTLAAHDVFTGEALETGAPAIHSDLLNDPTVGRSGGIVAP